MSGVADTATSNVLRAAARKAFLDLLRHIRTCDAWRRDEADPRHLGHRSIEIAAIDLALCLFETAQAQGWPWNEFFTVATVVMMNARPFTFDRVKARHTARPHDVVLDAWRRPVSIDEVSRTLGRPYSTVSRHIRKGIRDDVLAPSPSGLTVNERFMHSAAALSAQRDVVANLHRKLAQITRSAA